MLFAPQNKWQEGPAWERFFGLYDSIATSIFDDSMIVPTTSGDTQVHCAGNPENPPVLLLHGIATCSIMFDWLVPALASQDYYCIAIDTIGDLGRSRPKDQGSLHDAEEIGDWLRQVLDDRSIPAVHAVIGFSFGAYMAASFAQRYPHRVRKVIWMAPACVVAPINFHWLFQAISFGFFSNMVPKGGQLEAGLRKWFFSTMVVKYDHLLQMPHSDFFNASQALGTGPRVKAQPMELDHAALLELNKNCPTLLLIGEQETVIDPIVAVANAKGAQIEVKAYVNASHMFYVEPEVREQAIQDTLAFLTG